MYHGPTNSHGQKGDEFESIRRFSFSYLPATGDWLTRDSQMILYHKLAMEMVDKFEVVNFKHLPREENQMADALATLTTMF